MTTGLAMTPQRRRKATGGPRGYSAAALRFFCGRRASASLR